MFQDHETVTGMRRARLSLSVVTAAWSAALVLGCGGQVQPETPPVCYRGNPPEPAGMVREPQPDEWISLITKGVAGVSATEDCAGHRVVWPTPPAECDQAETLNDAPFESVVLGPDSVIERRLPNGQRLVWIITHVRNDGFAMGPIGLVELTDRGASVLALGTLRARYERVRLQLWTVGEGEVLVAEGETCEDPQLATTCRRGAQLMLRVGNTFRWEALKDARGQCLDTAWFELARSAEMTQPDGWTRRLDYVANVQNDSRYVVVTEQITVNDRDSHDPAGAPRLVRKIDTDRFIHVSAAGLVSRQQPLWKQALSDWASLERSP